MKNNYPLFSAPVNIELIAKDLRITELKGQILNTLRSRVTFQGLKYTSKHSQDTHAITLSDSYGYFYNMDISGEPSDKAFLCSHRNF